MRRSLAPAVRVLYGSQTGTANFFASQLAESLSSKFPSPCVKLHALDEVNLVTDVLQSEEPTLIVCSVFGEGEAPDNAKAFFHNLLATKDRGNF